MLSEKEAFKVGFLRKCADAGLTMEEIKLVIKQASDFVKKADIQDLITKPYNTAWDVTANMAKSLGSLGLAGAVVGPAAIGGGLGLGLAAAGDLDDTDIKTIKQRELIDEYKKQMALLHSKRKGVYKRTTPGM